jgi:hypothetical protein
MQISVINSIQSNSITAGKQSHQGLRDSLHTRAILWTSEPIAAQCLSQVFQIAIASDDLKPGNHIIALEDELQIRQLYRKIQSIEGTQIQIYQLESPIENFLAGIGEDAAPMIGLGAIPYEQWLKSLRDTSLELEDAVAIARDILKSEPDSPERNIALDILRRRADVSEYNWDKKYLDSIRVHLESALALPTEIDPTERKRLELKALSQERDPDKLTDRIIAFCRRYGWSRKDVEQRIRQFKTSTTTPKAKRLKGKDFLTLETESIGWVFPGIIPSRGVVVLGGNAGVGKTTIVYDAVGSLLLGEEFLGEKPVKKGKVLVVTGDELPCFTQDKLIERGIPVDNEDWEIILNWDISQWEVLEEAIADIKPSLVVIDSFSSIHRDPSFDENSSQAKSTIYDLEALTNTYNCGCILIHHLSKSKDNKGVGKLRGSSAISAAASVVCLMEQTPNGTRHLSFPKIRGAQTAGFSVQLDNSTGRFEVIGGGDNAETKSLSDRILAFLSKEPYKRFEQEEITSTLLIPPSKKDNVYQALGRLFKRGLITKRPSKQGGKRKVYGLTNPSQLSHTQELGTVTDALLDTPPPPRLNVSVQISETVDKQEIPLTDTVTDTLTDSELTHPNGVQTDSSSNHCTESILTELTLTDTQGCVCVEESIELSHYKSEIVPDPWDEVEQQEEEEIIALPPLEQSDSTLGDLSEEWMDESVLIEMAKDLSNCKSMMELAIYLGCWNPQAVIQACSRLSPEKVAQIQGWEKELDKVKADFQVGDRVYVATAPHSDSLAPYLIESIEGSNAKLEYFAKLIPLVELRKS